MQCFGLTQEQTARAFFLSRFRSAKAAFVAGELGACLHASYPDVLSAFDGDLEERTWGHFINGTYGICTRDGQPGTIFQKQIGVESEFAPHEVAESSRQRCIIDVRERYLAELVAA